MEIYNITNNKKISPATGTAWYQHDQEYVIFAEQDDALILREIFGFDPETVDECLNVDENVHFDSYDHYDFISLNHFVLSDAQLQLEEINLYIGANYVIMVGDLPGTTIQGVKLYILNKTQSSQNRRVSHNRVYYWLFDRLMTNYFNTLEILEDRLNELESEIINNAEKRHFKQILHWREQSFKAMKYLRPLLYVGDQLIMNENHFVQKDNLRYFKNIDIRINKLYDFAQTLKDRSDQMIYLYDSTLTAATNDRVTRLTVFALFFGPLTVLTGIYGMNFEHMPELRWLYGYPTVLAVMLSITVILYFVFRRRKWL